MGRGRRLPLLTLTPEDRETLQGWSRRRTTELALALRSRIVLRGSTEWTATAIALEQGVCIQTVSKWRHRYAVSGPDGLLDEARPGQPRKLGDADIERVIVRTVESSPNGATHWSTRSMAQVTGLNQTAVSRIWRAFALQPHRPSQRTAKTVSLDKISRRPPQRTR